MRKLTQQELERHLWGAADILRGTVDAGDYKQYIFGLLFYKRLCDVWDEEYEALLVETGDRKEAADPDEHRFHIPPVHRWDAVRKQSTQIGQRLNNALVAIEDANLRLRGVFGDVDFANQDRFSDALLEKLLAHFERHRLRNADVPADMLGDAYLYLIKMFAEGAGKKGGEFYTPRQIVRLMVEIVQPRPGMSIYDPTCGSAGMLLEAVQYLKDRGENARSLSLYGQEKNFATWGIAEINLFLHDVDDAFIAKGDTILTPKRYDPKAREFVEGVGAYDRVLANPPFSEKVWGYEVWQNGDPFGRDEYGCPPKGYGDLAFVQHMLASLKNGGMLAVVVPHGVLFRGGAEGRIREAMLAADVIEAVVGLAPNLFYGAGIPAALLICRKKKPADRRGKVFVNGIPLVVIEAKSPLKATAKAEEAFEQIKQYERDVPRLFAPNVFNIITDGIVTLYGATGAPSGFYAPWADAWPRKREDFVDDLAKDLWCLCEPARLLDMLAHFIVFETDLETGRKMKKICRYQQFRAVNKALERVAGAEYRKGLIWHTQGSGKSLTMVFLALKLKTHLTLDAVTLANPNILVLTDRIDLDDQISKTFVACGLPNPTQCGSVADLREAVARGGNGQILLSTIFKFAGSKQAIPNSDNWIVLVDECHRTQEKDLGAYLQATLPDAHFYGFTGTPIKSTDKDTYARFSIEGEGYLDKYGIDDAVRDGATVPILYEGRKADWAIEEAEINVLFDRWFVDLTDEKREELKKKGLTLAVLAKHPERVRLIALDIWEHFKATCQPDGFKAQIVVVDREAVILYRAALSCAIAADLQRGGLNADSATAQADAMIACVYSKSQEDNKPSEIGEVAELRVGLEAHYLDDAAEKEVKKGFKAAGLQPSFLIVCDKLLTGFDAPIEHVMYLDKPLKEHGLLQAIARTNRTCSLTRPGGGEVEKPNGRIVDYIGVTNHLDDALKSYRSEDVENALRDIAILRNDLKEAHARYRVQKKVMGLEDLDEKAAAYAVGKVVVEGREDEWFDLQRLGRIFIKVYSDLSPDPAILEFTAEVKWAAAFLRLATQVIAKDESLDHRSYSGKIRDVLEQHVHVTGLSTTIRLRNITDPGFADDFETADKTEEQLHEAFVRKSAELRRVTRELVNKNPAQYGQFSERVLEIIRRFEEGQISAAEGLRELEGLAGGINAEKAAHVDLGMDPNAFSILRILEPLAPAVDHAALQAAAISIGAVYAEAQASQPAFTHMPEYLRSLRQQVRRILTDKGIGETKVIREKVEEFAIVAYGGGSQ